MCNIVYFILNTIFIKKDMLNKTIKYSLLVISSLIIVSILYYISNLFILIPITLLILIDQRIRFKDQYFEIKYLKLTLDSNYVKPNLPIFIDTFLLFTFYIIWYVINRVRGLF